MCKLVAAFFVLAISGHIHAMPITPTNTWQVGDELWSLHYETGIEDQFNKDTGKGRRWNWASIGDVIGMLGILPGDSPGRTEIGDLFYTDVDVTDVDHDHDWYWVLYWSGTTKDMIGDSQVTVTLSRFGDGDYGTCEFVSGLAYLDCANFVIEDTLELGLEGEDIELLWIYRNVPEPSILALMGLGLVGLGFARCRKTQS